jgi:hypothetical protein
MTQHSQRQTHSRSQTRTQTILEYRNQGWTNSDIARHFGISGERVRQIIKRALSGPRKLRCLFCGGERHGRCLTLTAQSSLSSARPR